MAVLTATGIEKSIADKRILRGCDLVVDKGERLGLVGINGCGKSTFLSILAGVQVPDGGELRLGKGVRLGYLPQEPVLEGETVADACDAALAWHEELIQSYQQALESGEMERAGRLMDQIDVHGWDLQHGVDAMLQRLDAPPKTARIEHLSGGELRRAALALTLLGGPQVLLLDEPTNHLDADATEWLQGWLSSYPGVLVLVTHDRYLLEAVATRIVEIEDGESVSYSGSYGDYLLDRAERVAQRQRSQDRRLSLIAREAAWAARSPAARTTKQKGRLKRLEELRATRAIALEGTMELDLNTSVKRGMTLVELRDLSKSFGEDPLIAGLSFSLRPGDRLGITGPNGSGKSTLLRLIEGSLEADSGEVLKGRRVKLALFNQERSGLDGEDSVFEAAGGGNDHVWIGDQAVHVAGFLNRFLFERRSFDQPVSSLSGGERARLLLAKLLLQGCNLILLDEPTNDLDLSTLRVLEEALLSFNGAAIVVTHDRAFLDRACNQLLGPHEQGRWVLYADRLQYNRARMNEAKASAARKPSGSKKGKQILEEQRTRRSRKLRLKEREELESLPQKIEEMELELSDLNEQLADPDLYKTRGDQVNQLTLRLAELKPQIDALYRRWTELDGLEG